MLRSGVPEASTGAGGAVSAPRFQPLPPLPRPPPNRTSWTARPRRARADARSCTASARSLAARARSTSARARRSSASVRTLGRSTTATKFAWLRMTRARSASVSASRDSAFADASWAAATLSSRPARSINSLASAPRLHRRVLQLHLLHGTRRRSPDVPAGRARRGASTAYDVRDHRCRRDCSKNPAPHTAQSSPQQRAVRPGWYAARPG